MMIKSGPFALIGGVHVHPVLPPGYGPGVPFRLNILSLRKFGFKLSRFNIFHVSMVLLRYSWYFVVIPPLSVL